MYEHSYLTPTQRKKLQEPNFLGHTPPLAPPRVASIPEKVVFSFPFPINPLTLLPLSRATLQAPASHPFQLFGHHPGSLQRPQSLPHLSEVLLSNRSSFPLTWCDLSFTLCMSPESYNRAVPECLLPASCLRLSCYLPVHPNFAVQLHTHCPFCIPG